MPLDNLIKDIYITIDKGVDSEKLNKALSESLPSLHEVLLARLSPNALQSQDLRMSSIGDRCHRKLWYKKHKPETAEELQPWVKIKFLYGDIIEWFALFLVSLAGYKVEGQQTELEVSGVKGHRDAIINGTLIDVKSANSRGFVKFKNHGVMDDDPFGYYDQLSLYHHASKPELTNKDTAAFLAFDKEMGHLVLDEYPMPERDWDTAVRKLKEVVDNKDQVPERGYQPIPHNKSGNMQLDMACRYCPFKKECFPELRTFLYNSGPVFLTTVNKTPDVMEITNK